MPELKASLETITKTANILITSIDRHFAEVCKERGIDLTAQQPERVAMEAPQPLPELPDTPERFIGDMLDLMDRLYAAGQIDKNFPPENREQLKAKLARDLGANPAMFRAVLEKFVREGTGAAEAGELLKRLDDLTRYVYKIEPNLRTVGADDRHFIQIYERTAEGKLNPGRALFFGTADKCANLLERLQSGELGPDDFFQISSARVTSGRSSKPPPPSA